MVIIALIGLVLVPYLPANAALLDLNEFYKDPTVTVELDGSSALLEEDPFFSPVVIANDPGLGDSEVIFAEIGGVSQILNFNFVFDEPAGNFDQFGAFIINAETGLSAGSGYEYFTDVSGAGTISFDLTALSGLSLGLQFQLLALPQEIIPPESIETGDSGLDSTVRISNLRIEPAGGSTPIPEPATMLLIGTGFLGLIGMRRRKLRPKN